MASDAHAHPWYLAQMENDCEDERRRLGIRCAASAFAPCEWLANEERARETGDMALCFALHPQFFAQEGGFSENTVRDTLEFLERLAREGRLDAVGEMGFDLYDNRFRATEALQTAVFEEQLRIALHFGLPAVLHIRRAMRLVFRYAKELVRLPAVVFHSFPGSIDEARALLRRGINAYFSYALTITDNHLRAMRCCAALSAERLLCETDAPYQCPRGKSRTSYRDIFQVIEAAASLRNTSRREIEEQCDANWNAVFGARLPAARGRA